MMTLILNGKTSEPIDITSFSRVLDVADTNVRFNLDFHFEGNYSAAGVEYLADYADNAITSIHITNENGDVLLDNGTIQGKLRSLSESCDGTGRRGYGAIAIYENGTTL